MNKNNLKLATKIASISLGTAIGIFVPGPLGSIIGNIASEVTDDFLSRSLSKNETTRVQKTSKLILEQISLRLESHNPIRSDKVLEKYLDSASEICEGVLMKCKDSFEERKIKYIANIFVNFCFNSSISPTIANKLLYEAENITYRKMIVISFFGLKLSKTVDVRFKNIMKHPYAHHENKLLNVDLDILKQDIFDLFNQGIINHSNIVAFTSDEIVPSIIELTEYGKFFYTTLGLVHIEASESEFLFTELAYSQDFGASQYSQNEKELTENYVCD